MAGAPVGTWWQTAGPIFPTYTYEEGCCVGGICHVDDDCGCDIAIVFPWDFHSEGAADNSQQVLIKDYLFVKC